MKLWRSYMRVLFLAAVPYSVATGHDDVNNQGRKLDEQLEKNPDDAELLFRRGSLHLYHGDWQLALDCLDRIPAGRQPADCDYARGRALYELGRYTEARSSLESALVSNPSNMESRLYFSRTLRELGELELAAASYDQLAFDYLASRVDIIVEVADLLSRLGSEGIDRGVALMDRAAREGGMTMTMQLAAAKYEARNDRLNAALHRIDRLVASSKSPISLMVMKGDLLAGAGRLDEANVCFQSALSSIESLPEENRKSHANIKLEREARRGLDLCRESLVANQ